ncbi:MAG: 50S ribosomal protein L3 [Armatimonadota bacterium]|nr:50S ribosomal protein L3 [Armatimonadota bacterium]MDR7470400.1 50S ribosomal protein L3 [Armatimonadota bacterium]MDR7473482.1 50S ribosomal protein L3 [Armatimonadota bacterium]MDR7540161.1 50S ribosomal protein L3 [Armatimonadota bacterium]
MTAIVGRKVGMTQLFDQAGHLVPVTLVEAPPNVVVAVKTRERHGYEALQVGVGEVRERRLSRPLRGVYAGARVAPQRTLRELRGPSGGVQPGQTITVEVFRPGDVVDVTGTSRGRGFAGAIKRHGFAGQRDTHGVSLMHRAVGSIGSSNVGRVWPGKRMPGRFGNQRVTVRGLQVVKVEPERNLIYLRGAVPGVRGGLLLLRGARDRGRAARKRAKGRERA